MQIIEKLRRAIQLVLALHTQPETANVPGYSVNLDPKAEEQLRNALDESDKVLIKFSDEYGEKLLLVTPEQYALLKANQDEHGNINHEDSYSPVRGSKEANALCYELFQRKADVELPEVHWALHEGH